MLSAPQMPWWAQSFLVSLCTVPYMMALKTFAECGCVQTHKGCCKW
jgi:hypothetical protein